MPQHIEHSIFTKEDRDAAEILASEMNNYAEAMKFLRSLLWEKSPSASTMDAINWINKVVQLYPNSKLDIAYKKLNIDMRVTGGVL